MPPASLPADHDARMERALLALDGLSVGDAFGASIFDPAMPDPLHRPRPLPAPPWITTDDTEMAAGIVEVLRGHGRVDQDELARVFERRYWADTDRGYGPNVHAIFRAMRRGVSWREAALAPAGVPPAFGWLERVGVWLGWMKPPPDRGRGSLGNGGAMRVAPVGAYFADDVAAVIEQARASSEVTHAHPDGIAGAVAVALAAAWAWRCRAGSETHTPQGMLDHVIAHTPGGPTREKLARGRTLPTGVSPDEAARELGIGTPITSAETVPFTLWCAARHLTDYEEAVWTAAGVGGDIDTMCAIVGGVVALGAGRESIPAAWLQAREPLRM